MPQGNISKKTEKMFNEILQFAWEKGVVVMTIEYKGKIYDIEDESYFTKDVRQN
jgi:hypothetical protein